MSNVEKSFSDKSATADCLKDEVHQIPTVLVTGFGPFRNHLENASWVTVKELLNFNVKNFKIIAKELPVEYDFAKSVVPALWEQYKPKLVVHCGVVEKAKCILIEKNAHNHDYRECDIKGQVPPNHCCIEDGHEVLSTALDVDKVLKDIESSNVCVKAEASTCAGRYLCAFTYYTSLSICRNTVFVHVPPIGEPYTAREMAEVLYIIISSMLKQIN